MSIYSRSPALPICIVLALITCLSRGPRLAHATVCGSARPDVPNGWLLHALSPDCEEEALLGPGRTARLYAVSSHGLGDLNSRPPVLLVHGLSGHPADLRAMGDRLQHAGYQVYALFFDDMGTRLRENGAGLAREVARLMAHPLRRGRELHIVAHSAGGLIARLALNLLAADGFLPRLGAVELYAIDTPWHGYRGPDDQSALGRLRMGFARPFMPDGLEDLRARSALFAGDPHSTNPALFRGLLRYPLPSQVRIHLCFAQQGEQVHDYTEGLLAPLSEQIAAYYQSHTPLDGQPQLQNFWLALVSSASYFAFQDELRRIADHGSLRAAHVQQALLRHFPRLPGDHQSVLLHAAAPSPLWALSQRLFAQKTLAALDDRRDAHAAADAQRDQRGRLAGAL